MQTSKALYNMHLPPAHCARVAWTYPGGRLEGACQDVVHGQLGVVAPRLGGAHSLGGWDEEAVLSPASTAGRHILLAEEPTGQIQLCLRKRFLANRAIVSTIYFLLITYYLFFAGVLSFLIHLPVSRVVCNVHQIPLH